MKCILTCGIVLLFALAAHISSYAEEKDSSDLIKEGLLGAGSGAVGGLASGAKGRDVWKGALAGAGINLVGGALLDSISGEHVEKADTVSSMNSNDAYSEGYGDGYQNGYKQGYAEGYKDGVQRK
ncbi:MAG: hypothetical protein JW994_05220 [Candidatus Omnitrophica bacterium]|nr:hypothetical protein [Candidatus Omnitrophota bacterium]